MSRFRKLPVEIDAVRFIEFLEGDIGTQFDEPVPAWLNEAFEEQTVRIDRSMGAANLCIGTLEGILVVSPGDWIIRGTKGELYPCKPDIFASIYEQVSE